MTSLLTRLRELKGPDREVDWAVAEAIGIIPQHTIKPVGWDYDWYRKSDKEYSLWKANDSEGRNMSFWSPPEYTASIDAALTLLPDEDWEWELSWSSYGAIAKVGDPRLYMDGEASTPAIALCIAALQARGVK